MFELRGKLTASQSLMLAIVGFFLLIAVWWGLAEALSRKIPKVEGYETRFDNLPANINRDSLELANEMLFKNAKEFTKSYPILPPPDKVLKAFIPLEQQDNLWANTAKSIWLNLQGYIWALLIAIPFGFLIGLFPIFKGLFSKQVDALRYLPLSALTGLFIIWFGIEDQMKIAFLAFGILVYLLPVVVQRIEEVEDVYVKTAYTLGASKWQLVKSIFTPAVFSKLIDDIRVLTAISWTYIIIAELLNQKGGLGALIFLKGKRGQIDKVFAILILVIIIGFFQDRIFSWLDTRLNPSKYYKTTLSGIQEIRYGIYAILGVLVLRILCGMVLPSFGEILTQFAWVVIAASLLFIGYGEVKLRGATK
jgi:NitT/TauT family transport system permease protein